MEPLKLISSKATEPVLAELARQYQAETGQVVEYEATGGKVVAPRVEAGEALDVVVLDSDVIDRLIAHGSLVAGSRVDLASSRIGVAVRAGTPRFDISTVQAVKDAVLAASTICYSTGPSGEYLKNVFQRWGIGEGQTSQAGEEQQKRPRIVVAPAGTPVAALVQDGSAELGFQQLSELLMKPGIELLGPVPGELQKITIFCGAIARSSAQPDAARALLHFMASPDREAVRLRHGMDPP